MADHDQMNWACVFRAGGFGDNLIATSVFSGLKKRYGNLEVIASRPMHELYVNHPAISKLTVLDAAVPEWGDGHLWQKWHADRAKEYKFYANLSHSVESQGVALRIQTSYWWSDKMRRQIFNRNYLELTADICGIPYDELEPGFYPTDEEKQQAQDTIYRINDHKPVIGLVLSGSRIDKWHPELDVIVTRLLKTKTATIIMLGAPGRDLEMARTVQAEVEKRLGTSHGLHLALSPDPANPSWPPRRICAQAQACDLVITPDTGPAWAIAMYSMPKIVLHSHAGVSNIAKHWRNTISLYANPERVPCSPCHRLIDGPQFCVPNAGNNGAACISDIRVDDVVCAVRAALESRLIDKSEFTCCVNADSYNASAEEQLKAQSEPAI